MRATGGDNSSRLLLGAQEYALYAVDIRSTQWKVGGGT